MIENLKLTAAADRLLAWAEGNSVRYVVASLEAALPKVGRKEPAPPVNLALVIDASGSMAGEKLESAKKAALGVAKQLRDTDRLSIVSFASEAIVHVEAARLTADARKGMRAAVRALTTRDETNLSDGWLTGAECVAKAVAGTGVNRVILLSDGAANAGMADPGQLACHASELAKRGIATSCVGIGNGYETSVLQAIAEYGGGRLHDAEFGGEIIEALMGELGEIGDLAARDVSLALHVPATARAALVGSAPAMVGAGSLSVYAGMLLVGKPRSFVFRITLPAGKIGDTLLFGVSARGTAPGGATLEAPLAEVIFTLVEGARNNRQPRDEAASMAVATAWHAQILQTAARMNRAGERRQARRYIERELQFFERYCAGLSQALLLLKEIALLKQNIDRDWDERTRKEMEVASYLRQTNRIDYRAPRSSWANRLNKGL
jgi:Ca-activated chloride channel family protein